MMLDNGGMFVCKCRHLQLAGGGKVTSGGGGGGGGRVDKYIKSMKITTYKKYVH